MRKRCKRKVYALVNPIDMAIQGACITAGQPLQQLRLGELSALDAMKRGMGTVEDWRILTDMMNIAEPTAAEHTDLRRLRQRCFLRYFAR